MNMEGDYQEDHTLHGGDDLEDDFIDEEEVKTTKTAKAKQPSSGEKNASSKSKGKQAPKVVKFFG